MSDKPDILLVMPPMIEPGRSLHPTRNPSSLLFLAEYLYKYGYRSRIIDCYAYNYSVDEYLNHISQYDPFLVGFTSCTENRFFSYEMIRKTKEKFPNTKIVVGGPHFTPTAREALEKIPEIDAVVLGDGEETLLELVKAFEVKADISEVSGIACRKDGNIVFTPKRQMIDLISDEKNISLFLGVDDKHTPFVEARNTMGDMALPIFLSVGCKFHCSYCNYSHRPYIRKKPVDEVINEIIIKREKFKHNVFQFVSADFMMDKNYVRELCNALIKMEKKPAWWTMGRADSDSSILKLMKQAGCYNFEFALESGSPKVIRAIRKGIKVEHVIEYAKQCCRLGIKSSVFIMLSLPEETEEDILKTREAIRLLRPYVTTFFIFPSVIYPGTEMEKRARNLGTLSEKFSWYEKVPAETKLNSAGVPMYFENFDLNKIYSYRRDFIKVCDSHFTLNPSKSMNPDLEKFQKKMKLDFITDKRDYYEELWAGGDFDSAISEAIKNYAVIEKNEEKKVSDLHDLLLFLFFSKRFSGMDSLISQHLAFIKKNELIIMLLIKMNFYLGYLKKCYSFLDIYQNSYTECKKLKKEMEFFEKVITEKDSTSGFDNLYLKNRNSFFKSTFLFNHSSDQTIKPFQDNYGCKIVDFIKLAIGDTAKISICCLSEYGINFFKTIKDKLKVDYIIDNDVKLNGDYCEGIPIYSINELSKKQKSVTVINCCNKVYKEVIFKQFRKIKFKGQIIDLSDLPV